jgi:mannose-6-phosphate isomerase-like protein (cupin superfamily)
MTTTIPSAADWAAFAGAPTSAPATRALVISSDDGERVRAFGNEILFKLGTGDTAGAFSLGLASVSASESAVPPHVHDGEDEMFIVIEGTYRVFANGAWNDCGPGSVVYLPRGTMHTFHVTGGRDGKHWVLNTSSAFREYYSRAGELFTTGWPDPARLGALGAQYGMRVVRPEGEVAAAFGAR